jgi:hypothetical protein
MATTPVPVTRVVEESLGKRLPGRVRYCITLQCGCSWWEEGAVEAPPPVRVGEHLLCHVSHRRAGNVAAPTGVLAGSRVSAFPAPPSRDQRTTLESGESGT